MRKINAYILLFSLCFSLVYTSLANAGFTAFVRAAIPMLVNSVRWDRTTMPAMFNYASTALHAAGAVAIISPYLDAGFEADIDRVSGTISRKADVQWVELDTIPNSVKIMEKPVAVAVTDPQIRQVLNKPDNDKKYPKLFDAYNVGRIPDISGTSAVGSIVKVPGQTGNWRVTDNTVHYSNVNSPSSSVTIGTTSWFNSAVVTTNNQMVTYNKVTATLTSDSPPKIPRTTFDAIQTLTGADNSPVLQASNQSELDALIKEFANDQSSCNFLKDGDPASAANGTAPTFSPPSTALSDSALSAAIDKLAAAAAATASAANAAATAATAAANARAAANAASLLAAANPGDAGLAQRAGDLGRAADAAEAAAAAARAASDGSAAAAAAAATPPAVIPAATPPTALNVDSFKTMLGKAANLGPYQLIQSLEGYYNQLVSDPVAPVIPIPLFGSTMTIDLNFMDPVAALMRWIEAFLITIASIMMVVRFWRGVS